jgi:hypothetical protein
MDGQARENVLDGEIAVFDDRCEPARKRDPAPTEINSLQ